MSVELLWRHQWLSKQRMRSKPAYLARLMCRTLHVLIQPEDTRVSWSWPSQPLEHEGNKLLFLIIRLVRGSNRKQRRTMLFLRACGKMSYGVLFTGKMMATLLSGLPLLILSLGFPT